jgi:uncharacterized protein YutE (UPF0331/DUF86 family)
MTERIIKSQSIIPRIDGVQADIAKLRELGKLNLEEFHKETNFVLAQFYLRRALEGVFNIGSHILARLPGGRATEYKDIALKLGELDVVDKEFAQNQLKNMAGYRNRLTHFYADISPKEIYNILQNNLDDFDKYLKMIKELMEHPEKFGLEVE